MKTDAVHQKIVVSQDRQSITIQDELYGTETIHDAVLIDLILDPALQRLAGVFQHGITALIGLTSPVTRLDHSIGAMLLARCLGASLEEQVASLLHDVSHTALSHVMDHAFSDELKGGSYHEVHKEEYVRGTNIPVILKKHNLEMQRIMNEQLFPCLEQPSPHLCADRVDYGLRDSLAFDTITRADARAIIADLHYVRHSQNFTGIAMTNPMLARKFADTYMENDSRVWSNQRHLAYYHLAGRVIAWAVQQKYIARQDVWLTDKSFWQLIKVRSQNDTKLQKWIQQTENLLFHPIYSSIPKTDDSDDAQKSISAEDDSALLRIKVRTIDPDLSIPSTIPPRPLSSIDLEYLSNLENYRSRRSQESNLIRFSL